MKKLTMENKVIIRTIGMLMLCGSVQAAPYVDVSVGNQWVGWDRDDGSVPATASVGYEFKPDSRISLYIEHEHKSSLLAGKPFNDNPEKSTETTKVGFRYTWN